MQEAADLQHAPPAHPPAHPQHISCTSSSKCSSRVEDASCLGCLHGAGTTQVRQWRQKRVLMRPEAAFPYVFAAEGAQHPPKKPPRSTLHPSAPSPEHTSLRTSSRSSSAHSLATSPYESTGTRSRQGSGRSSRRPWCRRLSGQNYTWYCRWYSLRSHPRPSLLSRILWKCSS